MRLMYELHARILNMINSLSYLGDPGQGYTPDEVRREIYRSVAYMEMPTVAETPEAQQSQVQLLHMMLARAHVENDRLRRTLKKVRKKVTPDSEIGEILKGV